ncbi:MAG: hemerythrin domain-containing protein [Roseovarius sp.]
MEFSRRTAQLLHEDHASTIALIEQLDEVIRRAGRRSPDTTDAGIRNTLSRVAEMIEREIRNHFAFEENELFPRLEEAGDVGIGAHLREEHAALLPLGEEIGRLAAAALETGFSDEGWHSFRDRSGQMIEMMYAHVQKEEMGLLPALEDLLEPEEDMELAESFEAAHNP